MQNLDSLKKNCRIATPNVCSVLERGRGHKQNKTFCNMYKRAKLACFIGQVVCLSVLFQGFSESLRVHFIIRGIRELYL